MRNPLLTPEFRELIEAGEIGTIVEFCEEMHPRTVAEVLGDLEPAERIVVLKGLTHRLRADIVSEMEPDEQAELGAGATRKDLAALLNDMQADDRVDLVQRLDPHVREEVLPLLERAAREDVKKLLAQEPGTVGAKMNTDFAAIPSGLTASQAMAALRRQADRKETIYYSYVTQDDGRLIGVVSLKELVLARPETPVEDLMSRDIVTVRAADDQELAAGELQRYDLLALPVVDDQYRPVGILTYDDVADIIRQETTEDIQRMAAVAAGRREEAYLETPALRHFNRRVYWVVGLAMAELMAGAVVRHFEGLITAAVIFAVYMPMIMATGGNVGSQSAAVIIRSIAIGEAPASAWLAVLRKEATIGLLMSLVLMVVAFGKVYLLTSPDQIPTSLALWQVGIVISLALGFQVLSSAVAGAALPLGVRALKLDPAIIATPALTVIVDVTGLLVYFSLASLAIWVFAG